MRIYIGKYFGMLLIKVGHKTNAILNTLFFIEKHIMKGVKWVEKRTIRYTCVSY